MKFTMDKKEVNAMQQMYFNSYLVYKRVKPHAYFLIPSLPFAQICIYNVNKY